MVNILRALQVEDVDLALEFVREYYALDRIPFDPERVRRGLLEIAADAALGQFWFVRHEGRDVGHALLTYGFDLEFGGRTATVTEVYLREAYRGLGLGTAVFEALERHCAERGVQTLELQAERENTAARRFYARLGFQAHDRVPYSKPIQGGVS
jgi:diamine N-acetyltransferase